MVQSDRYCQVVTLNSLVNITKLHYYKKNVLNAAVNSITTILMLM